MDKFQYHDLGYAELFMFENYLIKQVREGATVTPKNSDLFKNILDAHYPDSRVVYLSNRVHSYAVNPVVYIQAAKIPQLIGIGIISREQMAIKNARFEKQFFPKPFKIHHNLRDAIDWADDLIKDFHKTEGGKRYAYGK